MIRLFYSIILVCLQCAIKVRVKRFCATMASIILCLNLWSFTVFCLQILCVVCVNIIDTNLHVPQESSPPIQWPKAYIMTVQTTSQKRREDRSCVCVSVCGDHSKRQCCSCSLRHSAEIPQHCHYNVIVDQCIVKQTICTMHIYIYTLYCHKYWVTPF